MNLSFSESELMHIMSLAAAHDARFCRLCNAIVMQISWAWRSQNENLGGGGGTPPDPEDRGSESDLPF